MVRKGGGIMNRDKWILMTLNYAENGSLSPIQLQKSLFLLSQKYPNEVGSTFYEFKPYDYGPFNKKIYSDCAALAQKGFLIIQKLVGRGWSGYSITPRGIEEAKKLKKEVSKDATKYLNQIVRWAQSLTFSQLLTAIYRAFPEFKENSVFQE